MVNSAGGVDSHRNCDGDQKACPVVFTEGVSKSFRLAAPDFFNIRVVDVGRPGGIAPLHLKHARPYAGDLAFEFDSTLLAHTNPLTDAKFQDMRTYGVRRRVSRLRGRCGWGEDCQDCDESDPTRWLLAEKIYVFHGHRC